MAGSLYSLPAIDFIAFSNHESQQAHRRQVVACGFYSTLLFMITVSQYLSFIFTEITRARVLADTESLRIADEYAKSPLMKYFSVPRFKIPEMELSIPMVIAGAQYNNIYLFTWPESDYQKLMQDYVRRFGSQFVKQIPVESPEMKEVQAILRKSYADLSTLPNVQDLNQLINEKRIDVAEYIDMLVKALMNLYANIERIKDRQVIFTRITRIQTQEELVAEWKRVAQATLGENIRLQESVLRNLLISPETNIVKTEGTDISILQIRAKITEEGIFVNSVKNESGDETKVVDFE